MARAILDRITALGWAPDKPLAMPSLPVPPLTPTVTWDAASLTGAAVSTFPVTQGAGLLDQSTVGTDVVVGAVFSGAESLVQAGANPPVSGNPGATGLGQGYWRLGYAWSGAADVYASVDVNKVRVYSAALTQSQLAQAIAEL